MSTTAGMSWRRSKSGACSSCGAPPACSSTPPAGASRSCSSAARNHPQNTDYQFLEEHRANEDKMLDGIQATATTVAGDARSPWPSRHPRAGFTLTTSPRGARRRLLRLPRPMQRPHPVPPQPRLLRHRPRTTPHPPDTRPTRTMPRFPQLRRRLVVAAAAAALWLPAQGWASDAGMPSTAAPNSPEANEIDDGAPIRTSPSRITPGRRSASATSSTASGPSC